RGINSEQWWFLLNQFPQEQLTKGLHIVVAPDHERAEELYDFLKTNFNKPWRVKYFPGHEINPYSDYVVSERNLHDRFLALQQILSHDNNNDSVIIICCAESLAMRLPPKDFFIGHDFEVKISDIIAPDELARKLSERGYAAATSVEEPGTYALKG